MKSPLDNIGGDSALKSAFNLALYGLNQTPIVAIVSPLYRFEIAHSNGAIFNNANIHFSPCKRAISNN